MYPALPCCLFRAVATAKKAVTGLYSGKLQAYDELLVNTRSNLPANVHQDTVMAILSQTHKPMVTLETLQGQVTLCGVEQMKKSIGCADTYCVVADIRAIDDDGKPSGQVSPITLRRSRPGMACRLMARSRKRMLPPCLAWPSEESRLCPPVLSIAR